MGIARSAIGRPPRRWVASSDRRDRARRVPRAEGGRPQSAELQQPDAPGPLPAPRLEQLEHPRVIAADLAGQAVGDEVRQVEVADADRIRVAERADGDLGRGPRPDPGHRPETAIGILARHRHDLLEPVRPGGDAAEEIGPAALDADRVELVIRDPRDDRGRGREAQSKGSRCRLAPAADEAAVAAPGLGAGHLLLQDRRHQGLEDRLRSPEPDAAMTTIELLHEGMVARHEAGTVVVEAGMPRSESRTRSAPGLHASAASRTPWTDSSN